MIICCCCCCCAVLENERIQNSVNLAYGLIFLFWLIQYLFFLCYPPIWCYNEHILLHIESLTTTRLGVWLPTSCTVMRARTLPWKRRIHPKHILFEIFFFCFSVISHEWMERRNLVVDVVISSSSSSRTTYNVANSTWG
jgi:hypothetical protein